MKIAKKGYEIFVTMIVMGLGLMFVGFIMFFVAAFTEHTVAIVMFVVCPVAGLMLLLMAMAWLNIKEDIRR